MLVHICCSVDSHYFLQKLQEEYPEEKLTGFFYDPNIHPYSEYYLRLLDVKRSCKMLGIDLIEGEYDVENWLEAVRGLEHEPEKGSRCSVCFDRRFEISAKKASELGESTFTSTLLTSPKKSLKQLQTAGDALAKREGISFVAPDYRKASGTQEQNILAKEDALYRQDYCGCMFGLNIQRDQQEKLMDEMFSPISNQILPASIEERLEMYEKRMQLEDEGIDYKIIRQKFLNYRQFSFKLLKGKTQVIPAHALAYSYLPRKRAQGKVEYTIDNVHYMNREEICFITLEYYNTLAGTQFKTLNELIFATPAVEKELELRHKLLPVGYSLSPIIVVDEIIEGKLTLNLDAKTYDDTKEVLVKL